MLVVTFTDGLLPESTVPVNVPVPDIPVPPSVPTIASVPDIDAPFCTIVRLSVALRKTPWEVPEIGPAKLPEILAYVGVGEVLSPLPHARTKRPTRVTP